MTKINDHTWVLPTEIDVVWVFNGLLNFSLNTGEAFVVDEEYMNDFCGAVSINIGEVLKLIHE